MKECVTKNDSEIRQRNITIIKMTENNDQFTVT